MKSSWIWNCVTTAYLRVCLCTRGYLYMTNSGFVTRDGLPKGKHYGVRTIVRRGIILKFPLQTSISFWLKKFNENWFLKAVLRIWRQITEVRKLYSYLNEKLIVSYRTTAATNIHNHHKKGTWSAMFGFYYCTKQNTW